MNETLSAKLDDSVGKQDFERLFRKPLIGQVQVGPSFDKLVKEVTVKSSGPANSAELFSQVCKDLKVACALVQSNAWEYEPHHRLYSSGLKIAIAEPDFKELVPEFPADDSVRLSGSVDVKSGLWGRWERADLSESYSSRVERRSLAEVDAYNSDVRARNAETERQNHEREIGPRVCTFTLSPINISVPINILDCWLGQAGVSCPEKVVIELADLVELEERVEAIGAKIHGSELSLQSDGTLLWSEQVIVNLNLDLRRSQRSQKNEIQLTVLNNRKAKLGDFQIAELVSTMFELGLLSASSQRDSKRKR